MKKLRWTIWTVAISIAFLSFAGKTFAGNEIIAKNLGHLYYMVNPLNEMQDPAAVTNFIQKNKRLLQPNSPTIKFAKRLGNKLVMSGLSSFSRADYNKAYGSVLGMGGSMEHARGVANSLQQGSVDAYMLGRELLWIADVVPKAANGDWSAFNTTGTQSRMTMRKIWPIYRNLGMESVLKEYMPQVQPLIEEQVTFLALMLIR